MKHIIILLLSFSFLMSCEDIEVNNLKKENSGIKKVTVYQREIKFKEHEGFYPTRKSITDSYEIDESSNTITVFILPNIKMDSLYAIAELEEGCTVKAKEGSVPFGTVGSFETEQFYIVSSRDGSPKTWSVLVKEVPPPPTAQLPAVQTGLTLVDKKSDKELIGSSMQITHSSAKALELIDGRYGYNYAAADYTTIKPDSKLKFTYEKDYTLVMWVKTNSSNNDPVLVGNQNWASSSNTGLTIAYLGGAVRFVLSDGSKKVDFRGGDIKDDKWHLIVFTVDRDGNATGYIDGNEIGSGDMSAVGSTDSGQPYRIGQDGEADYGDDFEGNITDVRFCNYVMGVAEMIEEMKRY